jgi:hypothetical protein
LPVADAHRNVMAAAALLRKAIQYVPLVTGGLATSHSLA